MDDLRQPDWWQTWDPLPSLDQSRQIKRSPRHQMLWTGTVQVITCSPSQMGRRRGWGGPDLGVGVRTTVSFTFPPALLYSSTSPRERTSTWKAMGQVDRIQAVDCVDNMKLA